ncbi:MAG TPA: hypothetical protein VIV40_26680, partial [Kofleriaceae bacterium]
MFDELLDADIETLTEILDENGEGTGTFEGSIAASHPVTLQCESSTGSGMVDVDYDGYYQPAGNRVTWPLGPSLVIKPNAPKLIATNATCQITLNTDVILDKSGTPVPADQKGPYKFKIAPIKVLAIDPPDDPDGEVPIDATQIYFDNVYMQFNTFVDINSLCPDTDMSGLCDNENVFAFQDVAHPAEGPGYCGNFDGTCGTVADCPTGNTICGRGFCNNGAFDTVCNTAADCATGEFCETTYAYSLKPFGLTDAEFGFGPLNPVEAEKAYTFTFKPGAKLKDRCGRETTITPSADDMTVVHFTTNPFKFKKANIATGETATMLKKPILTFTNVVGGGDAPGGALPAGTLDPNMWDLTPLPVGTGGAALTKAQIQIAASDASGQIMFRGHYAANTEYTLTIKA